MQNRLYYSLADAAGILNCSSQALLNYGVQEKIRLLTLVPDQITLRIFDAMNNATIKPLLMTPQLLQLSSPQCLKIEFTGKSQQCDFDEGFYIDSQGKLQNISPFWNHAVPRPRWIYWRTFQNDQVTPIDLVANELMIHGDDLAQFAGLMPKTPKATRKAVSSVRPPASSYEAAEKANNEPVESSQPQSLPPTPAKLIKSSPDEAPSTPSQTKPTSPITEAKRTRILRIDQLEAMIGVKATTIYEKLNPKSRYYDEKFPKQIPLGPGSVGWEESAIDGWLEQRKESQRNKKS